MSKRLVTYFSASGITAKVAENLADAIGADIFEIQPEVPYTKADLNWMDKKSRSTIEMSDPTSRPAIVAKRDNMDEYDTIFVGCPYKISNLLYTRSFNISWNKLHLNSDRIPIKQQQLLNNARDSAFYGLMISNHQNLSFLHTIPSFNHKTFREILSIFLYC